MSWIEDHGFETFGFYNFTWLGIDQAFLNITNRWKEQLWLYELSTDCKKCPFQLRQDLNFTPHSSDWIIVPTKFPYKYRFRSNGDIPYILPDEEDEGKFCEVTAEFGEFGIYNFEATEQGSCNLETELEPVNVYLPLVLVLLFYAFLTLGILLWRKYGKRLTPCRQTEKQGELGSKDEEAKPVKRRIRSLDTFRGLCIIIMIFVNDGGAGYYFFEHATWDGIYVADLVFPWFLWIMGVCLPISMKSQLKKGTPPLKILKGIVVRSLKLVGIGLMLASRVEPVELKNFRLPGVLQRFGICYFVTASLLLLSLKGQKKELKAKWLQPFKDITPLWRGWLGSLGILLIHTLLTFLLEVPGCPTGYLGPGGLHLFHYKENYPDPASCIGGATGLVDMKILTLPHIFKYPTALSTYKTGPFDPEGILGTLTSAFQVWLGVQAGLTLQAFSGKPKSFLLRWTIWAIITGGIGASLHFTEEIPINKNLWSLSYVLVTSSFALFLLTSLYLIIDHFGLWSGSPFYEPGMNSILLYVGHSVAWRSLPFHFEWKEDGMRRTHFLRLVESLWGTSLWVGIAIYLADIGYFWSL